MRVADSWSEVNQMSNAAKDNYMKEKKNVTHHGDVRINISSAGWSAIWEAAFLVFKWARIHSLRATTSRF